MPPPVASSSESPTTPAARPCSPTAIGGAHSVTPGTRGGKSGAKGERRGQRERHARCPLSIELSSDQCDLPSNGWGSLKDSEIDPAARTRSALKLANQASVGGGGAAGNPGGSARVGGSYPSSRRRVARMCSSTSASSSSVSPTGPASTPSILRTRGGASLANGPSSSPSPHTGGISPEHASSIPYPAISSSVLRHPTSTFAAVFSA
mmetsp:Transcript_44055/g.103804  ORF Transcript_44055/g.103804 Transcript_44055/m.103804 type:complete len:207 (-) Transcript_44055:205-825(-)